MIAIPHLAQLWSRAQAQRLRTVQPNCDTDADAWVADNTVISGLGLGLLETMRRLHGESSTFDEFEQWVLEKNNGHIDPSRVARINAAVAGDSREWEQVAAQLEQVPGLTAEELAFFHQNGYVILENAVPPEQCEAAVRAIWEFLGMAADNPDTWYGKPHGHSIWVPLLHHPALWANRNSLKIHKAFAQLWDRVDLWATVDQAGMNPPERPDWPFPGPRLHWDTSLELPIPFGLQGILYLTDTTEDQGAFTCVPGFHRRIEEWLNALPPECDPREQDLYGLGPKPIAARGGSMIIWHQALPHGSSPNRSARPRMAQYITMRPSQWEHNRRWR